MKDRYAGSGITEGLRRPPVVTIEPVRHACLRGIDRLGDELERLAAAGQVGTYAFKALCRELDRLGRCDITSPLFCRADSSRLLNELLDGDLGFGPLPLDARGVCSHGGAA